MTLTKEQHRVWLTLQAPVWTEEQWVAAIKEGTATVDDLYDNNYKLWEYYDEIVSDTINLTLNTEYTKTRDKAINLLEQRTKEKAQTAAEVMVEIDRLQDIIAELEEQRWEELNEYYKTTGAKHLIGELI